MNISLLNKFSLALVATMVAASAFAQSFVIKGSIKGVKNGTLVSLKSEESGQYIECAALSNGSTFELKGTVKSPMLVRLEIADKPANQYKEGEYPQGRGIKFMLENSSYVVSAACIDSVPYTYAMDQTLLGKAPNMTINGGNAQAQYNEWFQTTYKQQVADEVADLNYRRERYFSGRKRGEYDTLKVSRLSDILDCARAELDKVNHAFISAHPNYAISLLLQQKNTTLPFAYTVAQLDSILNVFANNYDKARLSVFTNTVNILKKYPRMATYRELELQNLDGSKIHLSACVEKGKYNFVDCWASWCGPCRMAIPRVKEMYKKMGDKVNIISVSVDSKIEDWQQAVKEENMPWRQFLVPKSQVDQLKEAYMLKFVPTLMVIDPEGRIQMYTSDPDKAHRYLEEHVK